MKTAKNFLFTVGALASLTLASKNPLRTTSRSVNQSPAVQDFGYFPTTDLFYDIGDLLGYTFVETMLFGIDFGVTADLGASYVVPYLNEDQYLGFAP